MTEATDALQQIPLDKLGAVSVFVIVHTGMVLFVFYKLVVHLTKHRKGD